MKKYKDGPKLLQSNISVLFRDFGVERESAPKGRAGGRQPKAQNAVAKSGVTIKKAPSKSKVQGTPPIKFWDKVDLSPKPKESGELPPEPIGTVITQEKHEEEIETTPHD